jgi:large subunit ribosomal protein L25
MKEKVLEVRKREPMTKGELNRLRKTGYVPGVLYSKDLETPLTFSVFETALNKYIYTSETHMILLKFDDNAEHNAIIKDVQFDPMTDKVIHVDLYAVKFGEVITVEVPVELTGSSIGVKEGGRLILSNHKLEIECLPREIPEKLEIDITELAIGDSVFVRDLSFDGVKILNPEDTLVVAVAVAHEVEEEEEEEVFSGEEAAEPEVISKGKSEEEE